MTVNQGDTVKITVKNKQGTHDLKIDEFNASTRTLNAGETQTITFVADKIGTFQYYCRIQKFRSIFFATYDDSPRCNYLLKSMLR